MLVAIGHHPKTGEGHQDVACCSLTPCFSPAQSAAIVTTSICAGTVSQSPAELGSLSLLEHPVLCSPVS